MEKYFVIEDYGFTFEVCGEFESEQASSDYCLSNDNPYSRNPLIIVKAVKVIEQKH